MSKAKDVNRRYEQWDLKYDPKRIGEVITAGKPQYAKRAQASFTDQYDVEVRTKSVLSDEGVSVYTMAAYIGLAKQFWAAQQKYHGESLSMECAVLIAKATARSLSQSVCEAIRSRVFDIPRPTTPMTVPS
jgi:hypothetical protein